MTKISSKISILDQCDVMHYCIQSFWHRLYVFLAYQRKPHISIFPFTKCSISPQNLCERQNFNPQILFLKSTIISIWQQSTGIFYVKVHLPTPQIDKVHQKELVPMPSSDGGVWELVDSLNTAPLLHSNTKYVIATRNVVYFASYENDAIWNTCQINQKIVFFVIRFLD